MTDRLQVAETTMEQFYGSHAVSYSRNCGLVLAPLKLPSGEVSDCVCKTGIVDSWLLCSYHFLYWLFVFQIWQTLFYWHTDSPVSRSYSILFTQHQVISTTYRSLTIDFLMKFSQIALIICCSHIIIILLLVSSSSPNQCYIIPYSQTISPQNECLI